MKSIISCRLAVSICVACLAFLVFVATSAEDGYAQTAIGSFTFYANDNCADSGKFSREICAHAKANAQAEFEEKAPHFATRAACEAANGKAQCALSFRSSAHVAGAMGGVSFTVRQQGFRIVARSSTDVNSIPIAKGLTFSSRTALARRTDIDPRVAQRAMAAKAATQSFGVSSPEGGVAGPLPPPVPNDPNFKCSDYIDPAVKGDPNAACAPAPRRQR